MYFDSAHRRSRVTVLEFARPISRWEETRRLRMKRRSGRGEHTRRGGLALAVTLVALSSTATATGRLVGAAVPSLHGKLTNGIEFDLGTRSEQGPVMVCFIGSWCRPCVEEVDAIQAWYMSELQRFGLVGALFVNTGKGRSRQQTEVFMSQRAPSLDFFSPESDRLERQFGVERLPWTALVENRVFRIQEEGFSSVALGRRGLVLSELLRLRTAPSFVVERYQNGATKVAIVPESTRVVHRYEFFESGVLSMEWAEVGGAIDGEERLYYPTGVRRRIRWFDRGRLVRTEYYDENGSQGRLAPNISWIKVPTASGILVDVPVFKRR